MPQPPTREAAASALLTAAPRGAAPTPERVVLHEGRALMEEGRVYSKGVGASCSRHNPRPVHPDPRGVEAVLKRQGPEPTSDHHLPAPSERHAGSQWGADLGEDAGRCRKNPAAQCPRR